MIFDAVSNHVSGMLSMEVFKSHISLRTSPIEPEVDETIKEKKTMVYFSEVLPTLKQAEQLLIDEAMKRANDNQAVAAMSLGISRQALNKRLKQSKQ